MIEPLKAAGSFRDPAGFIFRRGEDLLRQVNHSGRDDYDRLIDSGLYRSLVDDDLLIPHEEDSEAPYDAPLAYRVLRPQVIPFVSYPYEWSFGQLKDAALLTLEIQRRAIERGLSLKDASAYNVQFRGGKPIFIDTLSFEAYRPGEPWVAYRQFCEHFLAPLALMSTVDIRLNQLCRTNIDGVPLDLASRLLPKRSFLDFGLALHLHAHARLQSSRGGQPSKQGQARAGFSQRAMLGLLESLRGAVSRRRWKPAGTEWANYTQDHLYTPKALAQKERLVLEFLARTEPRSLWDLGANTGHFSRLAAGRGIPTLSFDLDPACVELNYQQTLVSKNLNLLPLLLDLRNPSPASGWRNNERMSFLGRGPADLVLALALVHHLAISGNLPLPEIASFFDELTPWLVIEFVPPDDPQALRLAGSRSSSGRHPYDQEAFEQSFKSYFHIQISERLVDCGRVLYLMRRKDRR
ncbi:SAM-dependent methyltransferase [Singulisphaera rosea]